MGTLQKGRCKLLDSYLQQSLAESCVHEIVEEAVDLERAQRKPSASVLLTESEGFCCDALSVSLIGMNATLMEQYIKFVADRLLVASGYRKLYNEANSFNWMEQISLQGKTNFFEKRVGGYQKSGVLSALHGRCDSDIHDVSRFLKNEACRSPPVKRFVIG